MSNLLKNGNFESNWGDENNHRCLVVTDSPTEIREIGNVFTPPGWLTWFLHMPGTWDQPEVKDSWLDYRRRSGEKAILFFTFYRRHNGGFRQQVDVTPGTTLRLTAWAHAWSNHTFDHEDEGHWSEGAGYEQVAWAEGSQPDDTGLPQEDAKPNFTFLVGLDPTGGTDPLGDTVIWGKGFHIYNGYVQPLTVEAVAQSNTVTVFLRSITRWAFKHNDAYWDDAELVVVNGEPSEPPAPTPDPPSPEPPTPGATKLGPHVLRGTDDLADYIAAKPAVVKLVGGWGMATDVPDGTLVIGRKHQADYDAQLQRVTGKTPLEAARQFVQDQLDTYQSNPYITYWEGHNEPVWSTEEEMDWYAQFEVERMQLMADLGLKCVIGNFATGTPDLALWPAFLPALQAAKQYQAILGLHEYSCPWMWWMTGNHQLDPNEDQGDEGWTTLRYRKIYRQHLIPNGLGDVPLVITECGLDPMVSPGPEGCPSGTWRQLGDFWRDHDGEPDKADYYFRQLVWYDQELQKDAYVIGATLFTWGSFGPPWSDFDVSGTDVAQKLIAYTLEHPAASFAYPTERPRGAPREQYERTFVLMPPDADSSLVRLIVEMTWARDRWTIGGSADDAGIGDLDIRRVLAIDPGKWDGSLQDFLTQHYEGAIYWPLEYDNEYQLQGRLLAYGLKEAGFVLAPPTTHQPPYTTDVFGRWRDTYYHNGLDLRSSWSQWEDELLACVEGEVIVAGYNNAEPWFGQQVRIRTTAPDGREVLVRYAHLVEGRGIYVKVGDQVTIGQKLGRPDDTGTSTGDHLHLDVKVGDFYADPDLLICWS